MTQQPLQTAANAAQTSWAAPPVEFVEAIKICLKKKYVDFSGRASRSEFWWFVLFFLIAGFFIVLLAGATMSHHKGPLQTPVTLVFLSPLIIPLLSVGSRRLHDTGKSGWWQLLPWVMLLASYFAGFAGFVFSFGCALFLFLPKGHNSPNRFDSPNMSPQQLNQPSGNPQ